MKSSMRGYRLYLRIDGAWHFDFQFSIYESARYWAIWHCKMDGCAAMVKRNGEVLYGIAPNSAK